MFNGCFKEVSRMFLGHFKGLSSFKGVLWKFHGRGSFKGVSRVFQESFKKTFKVFLKSSMLHGTHRSFPSRRRACFSFQVCLDLREGYNCCWLDYRPAQYPVLSLCILCIVYPHILWPGINPVNIGYHIHPLHQLRLQSFTNNYC